MNPDKTVGWENIPSGYDEPDGAFEPSQVLAEVRNGAASRRTAIKTVAALGGALGITALGWLPPMRARHASATVGTQHANCNIYSYDNLCWPYEYSYQYCGSDGWFLNYSNAGGWAAPLMICGSPEKNAWKWPTSGRTYRCADGQIATRGSSPQPRICAWGL